MSAFQLWVEAMKPSRAVIVMSQPERVATSRYKSAMKTKFEAYLTLNGAGMLCYYFNPNARFAFIIPDNVIEIQPIDTMELWYRARKAAEHIKADRIHGRELDGAFENNDGDEMCAALYRMALKSPKLKSAIMGAWKEHGWRDTFQENGTKFLHLSDEQLSQRAKQRRCQHVWETRSNGEYFVIKIFCPKCEATKPYQGSDDGIRRIGDQS